MRRSDKNHKPASDRELGRYMRSGRRLAGLGLPADSDCKLPQIVITCGRYVRIEHHTGLLQMTQSTVRVYSALGIIKIEGSGLAASDMDADVLLIEGSIKSASFEQFCQKQGNFQ